MIESIVNAFTKNSFLFSKNMDNGEAGFQKTLAQYDQQVSEKRGSQQKTNDPFKFEERSDYKSEEYYQNEEVEKDDYEYEETGSEEETVSKEETEKTDESTSSKHEEMEILPLLEKLGLSEESLKNLKEIVANPNQETAEEVLKKVLSELKSSLSKDLPPELSKKLHGFADKFQELLKDGGKDFGKKLNQLVQNFDKQAKTAAKQPALQQETAGLKPEVEVKDRVDQDIKNNNAKHAQMKEIAQDAKNVKFRTEVDPRFAQDTKKANQAMQAKQVQLNTIMNNAAKQQNGAQQQSNGDSPSGSPNFMKKMKTILKTNGQNIQTGEAIANNPGKVQSQPVKPSFMSRVSTGQFLQQLVDKIQNMVKANTTLSASLDFKSAEFGDMKLAAEAQGSNLAVKLSNIAANMKADLVSLKSELDAELRNLGFENIELDFGTGSDSGSSNAFEDEIQKRLSGDHVKLPGDHLADLKAIDEWMQNFEKVM